MLLTACASSVEHQVHNDTVALGNPCPRAVFDAPIPDNRSGTTLRSRRWQRIAGRCAVMTNIEEQLASIGFGRNRRPPDCWRAVRLDRPASPSNAPEAEREPACSRDLLRWRALLARSPRPSPYRISRA
jgi:hypothetical protein